PLTGSADFKYAYSKGSQLYLGNDRMTHLTDAKPGQQAFLQLLSDNTAIYGIRIDGKIESFDLKGKSLWKYELNGNISGPSIVAENKLIIPSDSAVTAVDVHSGKEVWSYRTVNSLKTPIYDTKLKLIIVAITFNNSSASDSIFCLTSSGTLQSRCGFSRTRIISNICLCGKARDKVAFGYIERPKEEGGIRALKMAIYSGVQSGNPVKTSDHTVPYLATNIASNGQFVLASGFEQMQGNLESGIDAFNADDTTSIWQRRFTQPLDAPVAISNKFSYFTLSFATAAEVPAKSIFYTLDLSTGKTLGELPITGVRNGSAAGMPTPLGEREFVLYDIGHPVLYFLKP
ncbi:MAG: PQQ-binding-like beta-propeller repeat protein, partial [Candidatus Kapaibacterium sp.]